MSHLPAILVASVVIVAVGLPIIFLALYGTDASRGAGNWDTPASSEEGVIALMWLFGVRGGEVDPLVSVQVR